MKYSPVTSIIIFLLLLTSVGHAVDFENLMLSGNKHYEQGEFNLAIKDYEKVLLADGVSAALHYNLGCAYFNQKSYGKSILHFEKAKQLDPRDADIQHNLEFSKLFLKDRFDLPEPMPLVAWFTATRESLALVELRFIEMVLFVLLGISIVAYRLLRDRAIGKSILMLAYLLGVMFVLSAGWLWDRTLSSEENHVVLLVHEANISSAPIPGSSTLFVIHEGTSAEILDATDTWYEIRLPDGKTGWIMHEAVGKY